jgi:hypothetical protein
MWFHLKLWSIVLGNLLVPYYLLGVLLRLFLRSSRPGRVALLSALVTIALDDALHLFGGVFSMSTILTDAFTIAFQSEPDVRLPILVATAFGAIVGTLLIPWLLARLGVASVDAFKKRRGAEPEVRQVSSEAAPSASPDEPSA